ncbi:MAG: AtpZ/AtpI family protein [Actinomycetota bacterium]
MRLRLRSQDLQGLDDGFSRAIELVVTPVIFALIGFGLDTWLGLTPVLTICLAVFAIVGSAASAWYRYDARMKEHEDELRHHRAAGSSTVSADEHGQGDE